MPKNKQSKRLTPSSFRVPAPNIKPDQTPGAGDKQRLIRQHFAKYPPKNMPIVITSEEQRDMYMMHLYEKQFCQYIDELSKKGMFHTLDDIKAMNIIDMSFLVKDKTNPFTPPDTISPITVDAFNWAKSHSVKDQFFFIIPCFKEGAIQLNANRWITFATESIDENTRELTIQINDYTYENGRCCPNTGIKSNWSYRDNDNSLIYRFIEQRTYIDLYTLLSPQELNWSYEQIKLWESVTLQHAQNQDFLFNHQIGKSITGQMHDVYTTMIITSNYCLSKDRPVTKRTPHEKQSASIQTNGSNYTAPTRRIRYVGPVRFVSDAVPKNVTETTLRKWHVDKWNVRGHMRRYADGRTIYIQPTVRHRRCLAPTDNAPLPTTIRIKSTKN